MLSLALLGSEFLVGVLAGGGLFLLAVVIASVGHAVVTPPAWLRPRPLRGSLARVVVLVPVGGVGRVTYAAGGKRCSMAARSDEPLPIACGAEVVVTGVTRGVAIVAPLH
ncbi:MAG: hypothetical protein JNK04_26155 [Myxococcales bacterium]|nr:hypothetical protein [Myxococcales bacterium]